jgi:hypothetical protein
VPAAYQRAGGIPDELWLSAEQEDASAAQFREGIEVLANDAALLTALGGKTPAKALDYVTKAIRELEIALTIK